MKTWRIAFILTCSSLLASSQAFAQTIQIAWDAPNDPSVTGYVVYYGEASKSYLATVDVGTNTQYTFTNLPVGKRYYFTVRSYSAVGEMSVPAAEASGVVQSDFFTPSGDYRPLAAPSPRSALSTRFDYDGDARADVGVFRPSTGQWFFASGANLSIWGTATFGQSGDVPISADFDGDRKMDVAVYRPSTSRWYILTSSSGFGIIRSYTWGLSTDLPLAADFDGDGRADIVVYRPSTGTWYVLRSSTGYTQGWTRKWGIDLAAIPPDYKGDRSADTPVPADYDGDGIADYAVYRKSTGMWYVLYSKGGYVNYWSVKCGLDTTALPPGYVWDGVPDLPVAADYDGDGRADISIFRNATGYWYVMLSGSGSWLTVKWGMSDDVPVPADYNGDGVTDIAIFRPSSGDWYFYNTKLRYRWGLTTDIPLQRR
jgi:hypothetical protein